MPVRPQRPLQGGPYRRMDDFTVAEMIFQPAQEEAAHGVVLARALDGGDARRGMLPVAVPNPAAHVDRGCEVELGEKRLVFVHLQLVPELLLESADALADF